MSFLIPALYLGVLVSSLTGSLHCVGMCGGLMINVAQNPRDGFFYHFGRLLSYLGLGFIAGYLGDEFFSSSLLRSFQLFTSIIIGLFFCWTAVRVWKKQAFHFNLIPSSTLLKIQSWSLKRKWISPAFLIGASSGLLPCGWLHTFVIAALATRSPVQGALLLLFFWVGTVPALVTSQFTLQKVSFPIARYSSKVLAVILLGTGLSTLTLKCYSLLEHPTEVEESCPFHHGDSAEE